MRHTLCKAWFFTVHNGQSLFSTWTGMNRNIFLKTVLISFAFLTGNILQRMTLFVNVKQLPCGKNFALCLEFNSVGTVTSLWL